MPTDSPTCKSFLTVRDLCERLKLSRPIVLDMVHANAFPGAFQLESGRKDWRIPLDSLDAFVRARVEATQKHRKAS